MDTYGYSSFGFRVLGRAAQRALPFALGKYGFHKGWSVQLTRRGGMYIHICTYISIYIYIYICIKYEFEHM